MSELSGADAARFASGAPRRKYGKERRGQRADRIHWENGRLARSDGKRKPPSARTRRPCSQCAPPQRHSSSQNLSERRSERSATSEERKTRRRKRGPVRNQRRPPRHGSALACARLGSLESRAPLPRRIRLKSASCPGVRGATRSEATRPSGSSGTESHAATR